MKRRGKITFRSLGPGLITGASDDDPSGILTYLQAGVIVGLRSLWLAPFTLVLMLGVQEMCARVGLVTGKGIMRLIKENYSRTLLLFIAILFLAAIILNIGADLLAMGVVLEILTSVTRLIWVPLLALLILTGTIFFSYPHFAGILKWLTFSLFFYIATAIYLKLNWLSALRSTFTPSWPASPGEILIIVAILGTTISPYLFFWQASEEVEEEQEPGNSTRSGKLRLLRAIKWDTFWGMLFSNLTMWFIVAAGSELLPRYGIREIATFDQAALVLQPLLGPAAFLVFGLGIIGTGLLTIPVLASNAGYTLAEIFGWQEGINRPLPQAKHFYAAISAATLLGMSLVFLNFDPVKLLIYAAVFYTLITPPIILAIMALANNRKLMGRRANSRFSNVLNWLALGVMTLAALLFFNSLR